MTAERVVTDDRSLQSRSVSSVTVLTTRVGSVSSAHADTLTDTDALVITLESGGAVRVSPHHPDWAGEWAPTLEWARRHERPLTIAVDAQGGLQAVLVPAIVQVRALERGPAGLRVRLEPSSTWRTIPLSHREYGRLQRVLSEAMTSRAFIAVAVLPGQPWVVDVVPLALAGPATASSEIPVLRKDFDASTLTVLSQTDFDTVFKAILTEDCVPNDPRELCIAYRLPDDGCHGRAHRVHYLLSQRNPPVIAAKVWLFGDRQVFTPDSSTCSVLWAEHVAPIVAVDTGGQTDLRVIDPSLKRDPMTVEEWIGRQTARPVATIIAGLDLSMVCLFTSGRAYDSTRWSVSTDETFWKTEESLRYRAKTLENLFKQYGGVHPPFDCAPIAPRAASEVWLMWTGVL